MAGNMENITGILNPAEKNKGEEPIVIAQRYLNIFRQLHIFDDSRKAAFNQSLLDLPPEIRGMFSNLPGGSVLQEYVNNLEKKSGIIPDHPISPATTAVGASNEELSQAKILATALAEAQMQAAAQMQKTAPITTPAAGSAAMPSKIVADAAFAEEIAKAVSAAIQHSDDNHRQEYSELIRAVTTSQEKVAALLTSVHPASTGTTEGNTSAFSAAPASVVTVSDEKIETLTKAVTDSQLQMAKMFLQFYNSKLANPEKLVSAEITESVTKAITDSQMQMAKMFLEHQENRPAAAPLPATAGSENVKVIDNSDAIVKALSESQKELVQLIMQHNTQNQAASTSSNANNIQINTAANFPPLEELVSGIVKAQSEIFREVAASQTKELTAIIGLALKESQQISTRTIVEALKGFHEENLKFWKNQPPQTITVPVYQNVPAPAAVNSSTAPAPVEDESLPPEEVPVLSPAEEIPAQKKKKKKKKKKEQNQVLVATTPVIDNITGDWDLNSPDISESPAEVSAEDTAAPENDDFNFELPDDNFQYQAEALPEASLNSPEDNIISAGGLDNSLFDFDTPAEPEFAATIPEPELSGQTAEDEMPAEIIAEPQDTLYTETETAETAEKDITAEAAKPSWKWAFDEEEKELLENSDELVDLDSYGNEPAEPEIHKNIWLDDSFEDTQPVTAAENFSGQEDVPAAEASGDARTQDWEWEYEEIPEEEPARESEENQDWEWEYEEVPEEENAAGDNAQDWEWEYEEASEEDTVQADGGAQDWEWEYEEAPEEENAAGDNAQDWEWEYEEIPEEENEPQNPQESREKDPYSPLLNTETDLLPDIKSGVLFDQPDILNPAVHLPKNLPAENNLPPIIPELLEGDVKNDPYQPNSDVK